MSWIECNMDLYIMPVWFFSVENILYLKPEQEKDKTHFIDKDVSTDCFEY